MMRFLLPLSLLFFGVHQSVAQTFTSSPGTAISSLTTFTDNLTVTGVGVIDCDYGVTEVCIDITHTWDADLDIFLVDPNGDTYLLTSDNGGSGDNYIVTCFDMGAATNVTAGSAPFNGSYVPEGDIGDANNFQDADGTWGLRVRDDASGDVGTLNSWSITFDSNPDCLPATQEDCNGGTTICSDATFTGNSSGAGNYSDIDASNDGCLNGENESSWYYFEAATDGTYAFMIETAVDYDFAVWGPLVGITCPPPSSPLRCSYSGTLGDTGLQAGAGDTSEGAGGDAIVDPITATAGDIFIILIDNYTADGSTYDVTWTLSGGATFDCTLLPIELLTFTGEENGNVNTLSWVTLSEENNSHYELERSTDGLEWEIIGEVAGAGNSSNELNYEYRDFFHSKNMNYYRLYQVDFNGQRSELGTITIDNREEPKDLVRIINLMGEEVDENYAGLKVYIYSDGSMSKVVSQR